MRSTLRDSLTRSGQGYTGAVATVVQKRGGYGARGESVFCITLTVREDTIWELSHPKLVSAPISRECTKLLLSKNRSSALSSSIASMSTSTGAKSLPSLSDISPISALHKGTNSEVVGEGAVGNQAATNAALAGLVKKRRVRPNVAMLRSGGRKFEGRLRS
jgi:hypothetical protein